MPNVIDFSWARPDPQAVKDAGFDGIVGYVGKDNTGKLLQKEWFDAYLAVGLSVTLVWELGEQRALAGYAPGKADAIEAANQAKALGYDGCIYFVLEDPRRLPTSQWPAVIAYARGIKDASIDNERGGYGSKALLNNVADNYGLIDKQWYVGPWGNDWDGADMVQTYQQNLPEIAGTPRDQYDEDFCPNDDWGQHPRPAQPQPQPTPPEDDDMQHGYFCAKNPYKPGDSVYLASTTFDPIHVGNFDVAHVVAFLTGITIHPTPNKDTAKQQDITLGSKTETVWLMDGEGQEYFRLNKV